MALESLERGQSSALLPGRPITLAMLLPAPQVAWLRARLRHARTTRDASRAGLAGDAGERLPPEAAFGQGTATRQELDQLHLALLGLPLRCRRIYLLHRIEGMNCNQIARHCGIRVKAVEKNVSRALRLLRERMLSANQETDQT